MKWLSWNTFLSIQYIHNANELYLSGKMNMNHMHNSLYCLFINIIYVWTSLVEYCRKFPSGIGIHKQTQSRVGQNPNNRKNVNWRTTVTAAIYDWIFCTTSKGCPVLHRELGVMKRAETKSAIPHWDPWYRFTSYNIGK